MKIETIISTLKSELTGLTETYEEDINVLQEKIKELVKVSSDFDHNWVGQWASPNYNVYNDFTPEELVDNILGNLTSKEFEKIKVTIDSLAKLIIKYKFVCVNCSKVNEGVSDDILNFF